MAYIETPTKGTVMRKRLTQPIRVEVTATDWDCFSMNPTPTKRDRYLFELLRSEGGVSDAVPPGTYYYNAKRHGIKLITTLLPNEH